MIKIFKKLKHCALLGLFSLLWLIAIYHMKHGFVRGPSRLQYMKKDLHRRDQLMNYMENKTALRQSRNVSVLACVISAERSFGAVNFMYPFQVLATFHQMLENKRGFGLHLCSTNDISHGSKKYISKILNSQDIHEIRNLHGFKSIHKETSDYISCLKKLSEDFPLAEYVVLNEGDGLPLSGFLEDVELIIKQLKFKSIRSPNQLVSHVKLYHPTSLRKMPYLLYGIVLSATLESFLLWYSASFKRTILVLVHVLVCLLVFSVVYFSGATLVGKIHSQISPSFFPLAPPESCCTVSILYPMATIRATIEYLTESRKEFPDVAKDTLLDALPSKTDMSVFMTEYNLVNHIGIVSTIRRNKNSLQKEIQALTD